MKPERARSRGTGCTRTTDLAVAELWRALSGPAARRAVVICAIGVAVTLVVMIAQGERATGASLVETLDGMRAASPPLSLLFAALVAGNWCSAGTGALVTTWASQRRSVPIAEVGATAVATAAVTASCWAVGVAGFGTRTVLAGGSPHEVVAASGAAMATAVAAAIAAGVIGSATALVVRSAAGATMLLVIGGLFVEPLAGAMAQPALGPLSDAFRPFAALIAAGGSPATQFVSAIPGGGPLSGPWPIVATWAVLAWVLAVACFVHRDVT